MFIRHQGCVGHFIIEDFKAASGRFCGSFCTVFDHSSQISQSLHIPCPGKIFQIGVRRYYAGFFASLADDAMDVGFRKILFFHADHRIVQNSRVQGVDALLGSQSCVGSFPEKVDLQRFDCQRLLTTASSLRLRVDHHSHIYLIESSLRRHDGFSLEVFFSGRAEDDNLSA